MNSTITFHAAAMQRALAFCAQIRERRNTIPVLGNLLIDASGDKIKVTATDLDIEGSMEIDAADPITKPVKFTISPGMFGHFVRNAEGKVTMTIKDQTAKIEGDGMEMEIRFLIPAEDFPIMPALTDIRIITIPEAVLRKTLWAVQPSIYYLNGAFLHSPAGQLVAVATDGHLLSKYEPKIDWHLEPMIMHTKIVNFLIRNCDKETNRQVNISQKGNRIEIDHDNWTIKAKTIDGTFPDYTRVIPKPCDDFQVTLSDAMLRRIPFALGDRSTAVKIDPASGKLTSEQYDEGTITLPITGRGEARGFNLKYLRAFARMFGTIQLTGKGKGDPALVHVEDPAFTGVIMPMRV